ncbi:ECF subfamily RNA polymerase sigma factor [Hyphomonas hirschiana VP5]|nr:sigma-70 family RNA polymerase sigma factor [Hyphomonas hirschiana]KCZ91999.1 ECF subfamily RNA polymerase sigma factor [Hyphomonas hirschiana VP5]
MVALRFMKTDNERTSPRKAKRVFDTPVRTADPVMRERHADQMAAIAERQCRSAFAELFSYYAPRVKGFMLRLGAADAEAEELSQEVMIAVWQKAGMYDRSQASVSTWIFRIARNRRIDAQRRQRRPELSGDDPILRPPEIETPDQAVSRDQLDTAVRKRLTCLPQDQLILIQAAFYDGLSHSEIARAFNLPLGTVKSRIRLAFMRLKGELEGGI